MGKDRVQKLMQLHGIRAEGKRCFEVATDSNHDLPIAPSLLDRQFAVAEPDKVWAGDITYSYCVKSGCACARRPVARRHRY